MRTEERLLITTYDDYGYSFDKTELYDMNADPYQTHNLAPEHRDTVVTLGALQAAWEAEQMEKGLVADPIEKIMKSRAAGDA